MAQISRDLINGLTMALNNLSDATQEVVAAQLSNITYTDIADLRRQLINTLSPILNTTTYQAAALASFFYDASREMAIGEALGADVINTYDPGALEGAIRYFVGLNEDDIPSEKMRKLINRIKERTDQEIKQAAAGCMAENGQKDPLKPKYARVPTGSETCRWCIMLASRGFVYKSEKSADLFGHSHARCDCRVICGWPGTTVEGYDPDEYLHLWEDMEAARAEADQKRFDAQTTFGDEEEAERLRDEARELMQKSRYAKTTNDPARINKETTGD